MPTIPCRPRLLSNITLVALVSALASVSASPSADASPAPVRVRGQDVPPALQQRINVAIERGVLHLKSHQHRDGSWTGSSFGRYRVGPTAFSAYVLVESGEDHASPAIQLALDFIEAHPPTMTYEAGTILMLLAEIGGKEHLDLAQACVDKLVEWENKKLRGTWAYPTGRVDLSNTQFAALGFWAAKRLGLDIPRGTRERMVDGTIRYHQEDPREVENKSPTKKGRSRSKTRRIAGFSYYPEKSDAPRGSMTVAGICVQRIAHEILGRGLKPKVARDSSESQALGLGWLAHNWTVTKNESGGSKADNYQLLYFLWGLERFAALLDTETIAGNDWYAPGAEFIVGRQKDAGGWGQLHETGYALLFLTRATRVAAASGTRAAGTLAPQATWTVADGPVRFRATGTMEISAFITGVEPVETISKVEWIVDGEVVKSIEADDSTPWDGDRFPLRWTAPDAGMHVIEVRLSIPEDGEVVQVNSTAMKVETRWKPDDWMKAASAHPRTPSLAADTFTLTASSEADGQDVARATDGFEGTAWIAAADDATPTLTLTFERRFKARWLELSHPASSTQSVGKSAGATRIRVTSGDASFETELPSQAPGVLAVDLLQLLDERKRRGKKVVVLRRLVIEIREVAGGPPTHRGFAELRCPR